jgi:signal transduction histidine kinase
VVRRLTRRLERLQQGVESLGAGALTARVASEGRDEVARLGTSLNRAAARIEELVGAHRALLANASHELRTPLTRIRMAIELITTGADPQRARELARDIAELDALIDEILLSSRLQAVPARDGDEDVDLLALAAEECARYEAVELDGQPIVLRGDARLLRRLIRNLLDNARRHGAPPIQVRLRRVGDGAELRVCDQGAGLPDAEREAVFQPFHRAGLGGGDRERSDPGRREATGGSGERAGAGLGLALVRQIARRHGGDARYLGRGPDGSCFAVTLAKGAEHDTNG